MLECNNTTNNVYIDIFSTLKFFVYVSLYLLCLTIVCGRSSGLPSYTGILTEEASSFTIVCLPYESLLIHA